jgi:hypothetical protein
LNSKDLISIILQITKNKIKGFVLVYGTGSCPCPPQGPQLEILLMVSHNPLIGPYFFRASIPY